MLSVGLPCQQDQGTTVAVDQHNRDVLVAGMTEFTMPGGTRVCEVRSTCMHEDDTPPNDRRPSLMDIWVRRYSVDGTLRWTTQFGTVAEERSSGATADSWESTQSMALCTLEAPRKARSTMGVA